MHDLNGPELWSPRLTVTICMSSRLNSYSDHQISPSLVQWHSKDKLTCIYIQRPALKPESLLSLKEHLLYFCLKHCSYWAWIPESFLLNRSIDQSKFHCSLCPMDRYKKLCILQVVMTTLTSCLWGELTIVSTICSTLRNTSSFWTTVDVGTLWVGIILLWKILSLLPAKGSAFSILGHSIMSDL